MSKDKANPTRPGTGVELLATLTFVSAEQHAAERLALLAKSKFRKPASDPAELAARIAVRRLVGFHRS